MTGRYGELAMADCHLLHSKEQTSAVTAETDETSQKGLVTKTEWAVSKRIRKVSKGKR